MSQFLCHCGFTISDTHYPSQTEGEIRTEQDHDDQERKIEETVADFLQANSDGFRKQWLEQFFQGSYPADIPDAAVLSDIRTHFELRFVLSVCECEKCGRLYLQKSPGANDYLCFEPRSGQYEGVLRGRCAQPSAPTPGTKTPHG